MAQCAPCSRDTSLEAGDKATTPHTHTHHTPTQTTKGSQTTPNTHLHTHTHSTPASARFHTTSQGPSGRTWTKKGGGRRSNRRGGKRRRKGASGWPEIVRGGGGYGPPQREELPPRRGGRKAPGGIASRPPLLGGGGIEVPLVSLRHPNNFDFFRPRRREKQQRRRVRTLFAVSPHKKKPPKCLAFVGSAFFRFLGLPRLLLHFALRGRRAKK